MNTYNYVGSNPVTNEDLLGLFNPWMFVWEVSCVIYNDKIEKEKQRWDEELSKTYESNSKIFQEIYQTGIKNCLDEYNGVWGIEGHKDQCKLEECIENNLNEHLERVNDNEDFYQKGKSNNPFNHAPQCIQVDTKPKRK
jgi:hypothetical protein